MAKEPKSSKKEKKEKAPRTEKEVVVEDTIGEEAAAAYKRAHVCAIAKPLASEKLTKKVLVVEVTCQLHRIKLHTKNRFVLAHHRC